MRTQSLRRRVTALGLVAGVACSLLVACQAIVGIHEYEDNVDSSMSVTIMSDGGTRVIVVEGGTKTVIGDAAPLPNQCSYPPSLPTMVEDPDAAITTTADPTYVLVVRHLSLTGSSQSAHGYDIDHTCTCCSCAVGSVEGPHSQQASCIPPDGSARGCDLMNGTDNQLSGLLSTISGGTAFLGMSSLDEVAGVQERIDNGEQTLLIKLIDYNGSANDSEVTVDMAISEKLETKGVCNPEGGTFPPEDGGPGGVNFNVGKPNWDGCDRWSVNQNSIDAFGAFKFGSFSGYVANNVLVVQFTDAVALPFGPAVLHPTQPLITATIVRHEPGASDGGDSDSDGGGTAVDGGPTFSLTNGAIQARLPAASLLTALGSLQDPLQEAAGVTSGLCAGAQSSLYANIKQTVCTSLDISQTADNMNLPCDAVSFVGTFDAELGLAGDTVPEETPITFPGCDGGPDDCTNLGLDAGGDQ